MILGDNIFYGQKFTELLMAASSRVGATIFGYLVKNANIYGVVEIDAEGNAISIEEKPECSDPDSPCSTEETES